MSTLSSGGKQVTDSFERAKLLNSQFHSVFTDENLTITEYSYPSTPDMPFSTEGIFKQLCKLDIKKSSSPDEIPSLILKHCGAEIVPILQAMFTQSMSTGTLPSDCLTANVIPVFKRMIEVIFPTTGLSCLLQFALKLWSMVFTTQL